jgi:hypothetical protein
MLRELISAAWRRVMNTAWGAGGAYLRIRFFFGGLVSGIAAPLYPGVFVRQKASRFSQHLRVYQWKCSRCVPSLKLLADPERILENKDHVLAVAVKLTVRIAKLIGGDKSCRQRRTDGFEFFG